MKEGRQGRENAQWREKLENIKFTKLVRKRRKELNYQTHQRAHQKAGAMTTGIYKGDIIAQARTRQSLHQISWKSSGWGGGERMGTQLVEEAGGTAAWLALRELSRGSPPGEC